MRDYAWIKSVFLSFLITQSGCAAKYSGPPPNFKARQGTATELEFNRFKLKNNFWYGEGIEPSPGNYNRVDAKFMREISPRIEANIKRRTLANVIGGTFIGIALVSSMGYGLSKMSDTYRTDIPQERIDTRHRLAWTALGTYLLSIPFLLWSISETASIQEAYNEDLRSKFQGR